jgi:hypothetical protein
MADLLEAAKRGNGPRVVVAPHMHLRNSRAYASEHAAAAPLCQRVHPGRMMLAFIFASFHDLLCRSSSPMPPMLAISRTSSASQMSTPSQATLVPNCGLFRAAVRSHNRLFTHALVALLLRE